MTLSLRTFWYLTIIRFYVLFLFPDSRENFVQLKDGFVHLGVDFNVSFIEMLQCMKVDLLSPHLDVEEAVNSFNSVCTDTLDSVALEAGV